LVFYDRLAFFFSVPFRVSTLDYLARITIERAGGVSN